MQRVKQKGAWRHSLNEEKGERSKHARTRLEASPSEGGRRRQRSERACWRNRSFERNRFLVRIVYKARSGLFFTTHVTPLVREPLGGIHPCSRNLPRSFLSLFIRCRSLLLTSTQGSVGSSSRNNRYTLAWDSLIVPVSTFNIPLCCTALFILQDVFKEWPGTTRATT